MTTAENKILQRKKAQSIQPHAGRPYNNPFHQKMVEEDFYQRAHAAADHYFDPSPLNTKKQYVLGGGVSMGKSAFWGHVFYYYIQKQILPLAHEFCPLFPEVERPLIDNNLRHFLELLYQKVSIERVGERSIVSRTYKKLDSMPSLGFKENIEIQLTLSRREELAKYRRQYQEFLKCWFSAR